MSTHEFTTPRVVYVGQAHVAPERGQQRPDAKAHAGAPTARIPGERRAKLRPQADGPRPIR
jgi:hypothetical protein